MNRHVFVSPLPFHLGGQFIHLFLNVRAGLVHSDGAYTTLVTEHLHKRFLLIGGPEGDGAVRMAQVDDRILRILAHHVEPACFGADGRHLLTHGDVQVLQEACGALETQSNGRFDESRKSHSALPYLSELHSIV